VARLATARAPETGTAGRARDPEAPPRRLTSRALFGPRGRSEQALVRVVQEADVASVSPRKVHQIVESLGCGSRNRRSRGSAPVSTSRSTLSATGASRGPLSLPVARREGGEGPAWRRAASCTRPRPRSPRAAADAGRAVTTDLERRHGQGRTRARRRRARAAAKDLVEDPRNAREAQDGSPPSTLSGRPLADPTCRQHRDQTEQRMAPRRALLQRLLTRSPRRPRQQRRQRPRGHANSPRPEQPTIPATSWTTSWDLTAARRA
jgi:hypothetical protein